MIWFSELWETILRFMDMGGTVLYYIALVLIIQWALVSERLYYYYMVYPNEARQIITNWHARADTTSWTAHRIRDAWISQATVNLHSGIGLIKSLVALCPLIGLLGTVSGMINVFDALASQGSGNARLMAAGISTATIPTLSGMVAAIAGLFISTRIESMARDRADALADSLPHH
jgi:biopolymer transport protein ExbB